jgi:cytochrome P450
MQRVTTSPLTLSTGHTLPTNTRFAFASQAIHQSTSTPTFSPSYNPASYAPPTTFDGFRFYKLRAMPGKENRHQFVTTAPDSLSFGHGVHACPGRFFASNEIKVVLIELLRNWDVRLVGDAAQQGGNRPPSTIKELSCIPNMMAKLEFKRLPKEQCV